jgi:hypothetical protein
MTEIDLQDPQRRPTFLRSFVLSKNDGELWSDTGHIAESGPTLDGDAERSQKDGPEDSDCQLT